MIHDDYPLRVSQYKLCKTLLPLKRYKKIYSKILHNSNGRLDWLGNWEEVLLKILLNPLFEFFLKKEPVQIWIRF